MVTDDIYLLVGTIIDEPSSLGLTTPLRIVVGTLLVVVSVIVSILLAFLTYWLGHGFSRLIFPKLVAATPQPSPNRGP